MADDSWLRSEIGKSTPDSITVRGRDLATELMGQVTFTEMAFFLAAARMPTPGETRLFDAALVALADHGLTPSALAARLTWTGATESLQGAVAAGLLGAGNVFLGVVDDTARFLAAILTNAAAASASGAEPDTAHLPPAVRAEAAGLTASGGKRDGEAQGGGKSLQVAVERAVQAEIAAGRRIPGLGHPVHKREDPRTPRLYGIAEEAGIPIPHLTVLRTVADVYAATTGKALPINGAGVAGAAFADLGLPPAVIRGFALLARTAGLVGHLAEEMDHPIGRQLWLDVEHRASSET